ncbi:uncharacterized protein TNCV_330741 [Trichonephila clavipes]|nr:uncharacterized protein TNCV_330741 [Trichonephila clavipes]
MGQDAIKLGQDTEIVRRSRLCDPESTNEIEFFSSRNPFLNADIFIYSWCRKVTLIQSSKLPLPSNSEIMFTCRNCGGGDRGRVAIYRPFGEVSLSLNRTVTCMVLKANDRRTSCPCHDEFRGPRSDYVRQVALATTTQ